MGPMGSFLVFVLTMVAVVTTCSGQVLSASSIVMYDVYQTYIAPFRENVTRDHTMNVRAVKAIRYALLSRPRSHFKEADGHYVIPKKA